MEWLRKMECVNKGIEWLKAWYFWYAVTSCVYVMEPIEAFIFNTILVAVIAMVLYTSYLFLPGHAVMIIHFLLRLFGVSAEEEDNITQTTS